MAELNPDGSFESHLEALLATVSDDGLRQLIRANTRRIEALAENSNQATRSVIIEQLQSLVERRMEDADGED